MKRQMDNLVRLLEARKLELFAAFPEGRGNYDAAIAAVLGGRHPKQGFDIEDIPNCPPIELKKTLSKNGHLFVDGSAAARLHKRCGNEYVYVGVYGTGGLNGPVTAYIASGADIFAMLRTELWLSDWKDAHAMHELTGRHWRPEIKMRLYEKEMAEIAYAKVELRGNR